MPQLGQAGSFTPCQGTGSGCCFVPGFSRQPPTGVPDATCQQFMVKLQIQQELRQLTASHGEKTSRCQDSLRRQLELFGERLKGMLASGGQQKEEVGIWKSQAYKHIKESERTLPMVQRWILKDHRSVPPEYESGQNISYAQNKRPASHSARY
ncbi:uncharacterized protein AAEQ78_005175 isoform 1-T1 [Lycaon pictus]